MRILTRNLGIKLKMENQRYSQKFSIPNSEFISQTHSALAAYIPFSLSVILLFLRAALFLWMRPLVAARSTVLTAALYALCAVSRSPPADAASNFFKFVFIRDLADLFLAAAFCVVNALFDADLILGICFRTPPPLHLLSNAVRHNEPGLRWRLVSCGKAILPSCSVECKFFFVFSMPALKK